MKPHLDDNEFTEQLLAARQKSHAAECEDCRAELDQFRREVGTFREGLRAAADRPSLFWTAQRAAIRARTQRATNRWGVRMALAGAVALVALAASIVIPAPAPQPQTTNIVQQVDQDELLMRQVDDALSSYVPEPLAPADLIATDLGNAFSKTQGDTNK